MIGASIKGRELASFGLVGVLNTGVSFIVFELCYVALELAGLGTAPLRLFTVDIESMQAAAATAVGYGAGVVNSFLLNRSWTFKVRSRRRGQFVRFALVNLLGLLLSSAAMFVLVDVRGHERIPIWLLTTIVVTGLNFAGSKYCVRAALISGLRARMRRRS